MILVFFILGIIGIIILILLLSTLKFELKQLYIENKYKKLKIHIVLEVGIYIFNKFRIAKITINNKRINKMLESGKIDVRKLKIDKQTNKKLFKFIKAIGIKVSALELRGYFATFNSVLSSIIYTIINSIIPILVAPRMNKKQYINNIEFLNIEDNIININISCIINVKIVNIINKLYLLKGGESKNGKSSNRRSYAYCNE